MSRTIQVLVALLTGLLIGVGIAISQRPSLMTVADVVAPVGTLWVNAIRMTVVPLVVSLLFTGIAGEKTGTVSKIGGKALVLFVVFVAAGAIFTAILAPFLLSLSNLDAAAFASIREGVATTAPALPPFSEWVVGLIPSNAIRAAADGAMLPLIIFTIIFGLAAARIDTPYRQSLVTGFTAVSRAVLVIVEWILVIAPVGVFCLVLPLAARTGAEIVPALASFVLIASGLIVVASAVLYPIASVFGKMSIRDFARACAPAQAVAFSTRSSLATLPVMLESAERQMKLPPHVTGMVLPVAISLFKFASPIARMTGTFFVAKLFGIELGIAEVLAITGAIAALSFYSPGIPSGGLFILTPVYASLGLPIEGVGLLIALDLIPDMFITFGNVTADMVVAAILGRSETAPSAG